MAELLFQAPVHKGLNEIMIPFLQNAEWYKLRHSEFISGSDFLLTGVFPPATMSVVR